MKRPALYFPSGDYESNGLIESLLSATGFIAPNFLLFIPFFYRHIYIMVIYNYIVVFLLCSSVAHMRFKNGNDVKK